MKRILLSICLISSFLFSEDLGKKTYAEIEELKRGKIENKLLKSPIDKKFLSIENGGTKSAIDAYSDGVGMFVAGTDKSKIDNTPMNRAVYVHGEEAKNEGKSLKEVLEDKGLNTDVEIIVSGGGVSSVIGESCDDGDPNTTGDMYVNTTGTCVGTGIIVRSENKCYGDEIGSEFLVDGISYLVVDEVTLRTNLHRAETLCTSNVTNMNGLFYGATSFNQDISNWDVSNVVDMGHMFYAALQFNQNISSWNTANVSNFNHMFVYARQFYQDLSGWDTSSALDKTIFTTTFANRSDLYNSAAPIFYNKNYLPK